MRIGPLQDQGVVANSKTSSREGHRDGVSEAKSLNFQVKTGFFVALVSIRAFGATQPARHSE
jgi:hypothetical protein